MNERSQYELISAYFDGELPEAARTDVERLLQEKPEYQAYLDDLVALRASLKAAPKFILPHDLSEPVLRKAERAMLEGPLGSLAISSADCTEDLPSAPTTSASSAEQNDHKASFPASLATKTVFDAATTNGVGATASASSVVRWEAPLWLAMAASLCFLYVSLGQREQHSPEAGQSLAVSDQADASGFQRDGLASPSEALTKSFSPDGLATKSSRRSTADMATADGKPGDGASVLGEAPEIGSALASELAQTRNGNVAEKAMLEDAREPQRREHQSPQNLARQLEAGGGFKPAPASEGIVFDNRQLPRVTSDPLPVLSPNQGQDQLPRQLPPRASSMPPIALQDKGGTSDGAEVPSAGAPQAESWQSRGFLLGVHADHLGEPARQARIAATTSGLLRSQIVVCDVDAVAESFFADFEQSLQAQAIAVGKPGLDLLASVDASRALIGSATSTFSKSPATSEVKRKGESAIDRSGGQSEVRVYLVQAEPARLARAISQLENRSNVRLRWMAGSQRQPTFPSEAETAATLANRSLASQDAESPLAIKSATPQETPLTKGISAASQPEAVALPATPVKPSASDKQSSLADEALRRSFAEDAESSDSTSRLSMFRAEARRLDLVPISPGDAKTVESSLDNAEAIAAAPAGATPSPAPLGGAPANEAGSVFSGQAIIVFRVAVPGDSSSADKAAPERHPSP